MVATRLERMFAQVRRWRSGDDTEPLAVRASLPEADLKRLRRLIDDCISLRGGELAARRRATAIGATFLALNEQGRENFFRMLADEYDHDDAEVDQAIDDVLRTHSGADRRSAERSLAEALKPKREHLLRRFVGLDGGLPFLVDLREELLAHRADDPAMAALDQDLRSLLETWFDLAILKLELLTWETPAALLEKLIEYEAVHAIESWDDLKARLGPGRRCYAFLHPMMPGEPLIFVEVALTKGMADDLPALLDHSSDRPESIAAAKADTAVFYSISNCHQGLAGVSLGDSLIKTVATELSKELPSLDRFATLSPIPGFQAWLTERIGDATGLGPPSQLLSPGEQIHIVASLTDHVADETDPDAKPDDNPDDNPHPNTEEALALLAELIHAEVPPKNYDELELWRPVLMRLAASYLTSLRPDSSRALDPVAHFHLSNGASIERLNWQANPGKRGWEGGLGMMVNYRYELKAIESNLDGYLADGTIERSEAVTKLMTPDGF